MGCVRGAFPVRVEDVSLPVSPRTCWTATRRWAVMASSGSGPTRPVSRRRPARMLRRIRPHPERQCHRLVVAHNSIHDPRCGTHWSAGEYHSVKDTDPDGAWKKVRVTLKPVGPDMAAVNVTVDDEQECTGNRRARSHFANYLASSRRSTGVPGGSLTNAYQRPDEAKGRFLGSQEICENDGRRYDRAARPSSVRRRRTLSSSA